MEKEAGIETETDRKGRTVTPLCTRWEVSSQDNLLQLLLGSALSHLLLGGCWGGEQSFWAPSHSLSPKFQSCRGRARGGAPPGSGKHWLPLEGAWHHPLQSPPATHNHVCTQTPDEGRAAPRLACWDINLFLSPNKPWVPSELASQASHESCPDLERRPQGGIP